MVDIDKAAAAFNRWNGNGESDIIRKSQFERALTKADENSNGLSRHEFKSVADRLGLDEDEVDIVFDKFGDGGKVDIKEFVDSAYDSTDPGAELTEDEFTSFIEGAAEAPGSLSAFEKMGGSNGTISEAEMKGKIAHFAGTDNKISIADFKALASEMGVDDDNMDVSIDIFDELADGKTTISKPSVLNFFADYSDDGVYNEDAFDELVSDLGGADVEPSVNNSNPRPLTTPRETTTPPTTTPTPATYGISQKAFDFQKSMSQHFNVPIPANPLIEILDYKTTTPDKLPKFKIGDYPAGTVGLGVVLKDLNSVSNNSSFFSVANKPKNTTYNEGQLTAAEAISTSYSGPKPAVGEPAREYAFAVSATDATGKTLAIRVVTMFVSAEANPADPSKPIYKFTKADPDL